MPHNRFFIDMPLLPHQEVDMPHDEAHHMKEVMRCTVGDVVELVNGQGQLAYAQIVSSSKKALRLLIESISTSLQKPMRMILALPLLRPGPMDWVVEKSAELGIDQLILYPADFSERQDISPAVDARIHKLIISAMKQSGRFFLPSIQKKTSLEEILRDHPSDIMWADKQERSIPILEKLALKHSPPLLLLAGPEKGWSKEEKELLEKRDSPVLLSEHILRAETAALSLVSIASAKGL